MLQSDPQRYVESTGRHTCTAEDLLGGGGCIGQGGLLVSGGQLPIPDDEATIHQYMDDIAGRGAVNKR